MLFRSHLLGVLAWVHLLSSAALAVVHSMTRGGQWWKEGTGCEVMDLVLTFSSEACVFLLTALVVERGHAAQSAAVLGRTRKSPFWSRAVRAISVSCCTLAGAVASWPLLGTALPPPGGAAPHRPPSSSGFSSAQLPLFPGHDAHPHAPLSPPGHSRSADRPRPPTLRSQHGGLSPPHQRSALPPRVPHPFHLIPQTLSPLQPRGCQVWEGALPAACLCQPPPVHAPQSLVSRGGGEASVLEVVQEEESPPLQQGVRGPGGR